MKRILSTLIFLLCLLSAHSVNPDSLALTNRLSVEGMKLYKKGNYKAAEVKFRQALAIDTALFIGNHYQRIIYTGMWLGNTLCRLGRTQEALEGDYTGLYCFADPVDFRKMETVDSLGRQGNLLMDEEKWREAYLVWEKRQTLLDAVLPRTHMWSANNRREMYRSLNKRLSAFETTSVKKLNEWAKEAVECFSDFIQAMYLYHSFNPPVNSSRASAWRLVDYLMDQALECCHIYRQPEFAGTGNDIVWETLQWSDSIYKRLENVTPIEEYRYRRSRRNLFRNYSYRLPLGSPRAHLCCMEALNNNKRLIEINESMNDKGQWKRKASLLYTLADIYSDSNLMPPTSGVDTGQSANIYDDDDAQTVQDSIGMDYVNQLSLKNALVDAFANSLQKSDQADQKLISYNREQAIKAMQERLDILKKHSTEQYVDALTSMASFYNSRNMYIEAIDLYALLQKYYIARDRKKYYSALFAQAATYKTYGNSAFDDGAFLFACKFQGLTDRAERVSAYYKAIETYELYQKGYAVKADSALMEPQWKTDRDLAELYYTLAKKKNDTAAAQKAYRHYEQYLANGIIMDMDKPVFKRRLAECKVLMGAGDGWAALDKAQQEDFERTMLAFMYATKAERTQFWNDFVYTDNIEYAHFRHATPHAGTVAYNANLFRKGILLGTETNLRNYIAQSTDPEVKHLYDEIERIHHNGTTADSIKAASLERELLLRCKNDKNYNANLTVTWKDVKKCISSADLAVEFYETGTGEYGAVVLSTDKSEPQITPLFTRDSLLLHKDDYFSAEASAVVWQKLIPYMRNKKNVYFAADGELHNIPIEYMPMPDGKGMMADKWQFYRLTSTRELTQRHDATDSHAVVYGGLQYSLTASEMQRDAMRYPQADESRSVDMAAGLYGVDRAHSGVSDLKYTKIEASEINCLLAEKKIESRLYSDSIGTETSFKNLNPDSTNIIHIATHGFYLTKEQFKRFAAAARLKAETDGSEEEYALIRSGLYFAGVNNVLKGRPVPDGVDDGILTAKEISMMNFRHLDLVVLSACQTALGDIGSDGVFGLQRGFKMAGAQTLLMSLWKVDDRATQMLMKHFYAALLSGKSKTTALREAQKYVREYAVESATGTMHPYQAPKYWAAFILLDDIAI